LEERRAAFAMLREVVEAAGPLPEEGARRLQRVAKLFDLDGQIRVPPELLQEKMEGLPPEKPSTAMRSAARGAKAPSRPRRTRVGEA
jgi:hypothetical protein